MTSARRAAPELRFSPCRVLLLAGVWWPGLGEPQRVRGQCRLRAGVLSVRGPESVVSGSLLYGRTREGEDTRLFDS